MGQNIRRLIFLDGKYILLIGLTMTLFAFKAYPDNSEKYTTAGYLNGRTWNDLNAVGKVSYVAGFRDGIELSLNSIDAIEIEGKIILSKEDVQLPIAYWYINMTNDEVVKFFDAFYSDPVNLNIPIWRLYPILKIRHQGKADKITTKSGEVINCKTTKEMEEIIIDNLRKAYNK